jgi:hypothetical protein
VPRIPSKEAPEGLRPYIYHGLDLNYEPEDKQAVGECPWCTKPKFSVEIETSRYRCFKCGEVGNNFTFIKWLWTESYAKTTDYAGLVEDRGMLTAEPLIAWGVARSTTTLDWIIPGFGADGIQKQVYRYIQNQGKRRCILTPTMGHQIFRPISSDEFDPTKRVLFVCEGPWDAMALWEVMRCCKIDPDTGLLVHTDNPKESYLSESNIIAIPGCNVFLDAWLPLFADKDVILLFDNDHPGTNKKNGQPIEPGGFQGYKRATAALSGSKKPPRSISRLQWGPRDENGWEYDKNLPNGHDVRDSFAGRNLEQRISKLNELNFLFQPVPKVWIEDGAKAKKKRAEEELLKPLPCSSYRSLTNAWRKALKWTPGLDHGLSSMLAAITSTDAGMGSQVWIKVIGPPSCGKSTLCEAVSIARKYVMAKDNIRGFHSGFGVEGEDNSLISQLYNKTLVTKDGDTLLQTPNCNQILSEARAIYDRAARTHYRNKKANDYEGVNMTWILCGTASLRAIDLSELGARFLDVVIMEGIDDELEDDILERVASRVVRNMSMTGEKGGGSADGEQTYAKQLTGGYVAYLRENAPVLLSKIEVKPEALNTIKRLAKFVAFMRARPSKKQAETEEREFAARLLEQHLRMAMCMAIVLNRKSVDAMVVQRMTKVAMDTARGQTLEIVRHLYKSGQTGLDLKTICLYANNTMGMTQSLLRFMKKIGIVEVFSYSKIKGIKGTPRWRLTKTLTRIYTDVMGAEGL